MDLDLKKKLTHKFDIEVDIDSPFNVGLIVGASGSGKTTLAKEMFGAKCFNEIIDLTSMILHKAGYDIRAKYSNKAVYKAMTKMTDWKFIEAKLDTPESGKGITRNTGFRQKVLSYCFAYRPGKL